MEKGPTRVCGTNATILEHSRVVVGLRIMTHIVSVILSHGRDTTPYFSKCVYLLMPFKLRGTETIPRHSLHHQKSSTRSRERVGREHLGKSCCVYCAWSRKLIDRENSVLTLK